MSWGVACIYFAWRSDVVKKKKDTGYYVCSKFVGSWVIAFYFLLKEKRQDGIRWKFTQRNNPCCVYPSNCAAKVVLFLIRANFYTNGIVCWAMDERRKKKGIYFLPNLSATSAQGLLIYNHFNRPCNEVEPMFMGL